MAVAAVGLAAFTAGLTLLTSSSTIRCAHACHSFAIRCSLDADAVLAAHSEPESMESSENTRLVHGLERVPPRLRMILMVEAQLDSAAC